MDFIKLRTWRWKSLNQLMVLCYLIVGLNVVQIFAAEDYQTNLRALDCQDAYGRPQRCTPPFENAAYNLQIEATNTCGEDGDTHFCVQTQHSNKKSCDVCQQGSHDPYYLTDSHNPQHSTWWQSETMMDGIQYPNQVNLTINLGKSFDITYIRLVFYSPRPESFAIYKRTSQNSSWIPYQYYSATCRDTYRLPDSLLIKRNEDEARALCTSEYSDISPLRDGNIAFSTLEGRPSAYNFDNSTDLQTWVTATDIKIVLQRLNTFGDEVFGDQAVLRSYFYAIADIAVGARCKCNGHASRCVESTSLDGIKTQVCECKHFTDGPDCERCLPYYNDAPWGRSTSTNAHECKPCNCNGFSEKCFFDRHLYNQTKQKHGGHCIDCTHNRDGPNCEKCKENFFMQETGYCTNCNCNSTGSRSLQCNSEGKCQCKPGVTGDKCDRCDANFYNFGQHGCQPCNCNISGSYENTPQCDSGTGECYCKENVEGRHCGECRPGFFNLDFDNKFGCTPCFCYGHTSECDSDGKYSIVSTISSFNKQRERWRAITSSGEVFELKFSQMSQSIAVAARPDGQIIYFLAPERFLGDQRASYNRLIKFKLQLVGQFGPNPSQTDVILEGAGTRISLPIFAQYHQMPNDQPQVYAFRLHENSEYAWQPSLSSRAFMSILSNLTAIKIRATYSDRGEAYLDDVELQTAQRGGAGQQALWIERCTCPTGYLGQFCESCAPGYRHSPALGGPFMPCIPCDCNKHAEICDSESGRCICQHSTTGDTCDQCARGYYGNALIGTAHDCTKCPCPDDGPCMQIADNEVICLECPVGYFGSRCELCSDGYYGDPTGLNGPSRLCKQCNCNGNVDPNAVGNCNRTTGACLKCIHNTDGAQCDQCLPGHFGDPLAVPHGNCEQCSCYEPGSEQTQDGISICDQVTGNCRCKPNVIGHNCNECKNGFFNIGSGNGCENCNCDPIGSYNSSCDRYSGQCYCKPGVTGVRCDQCIDYHYGFADDGCQECNCDPSGSKGFQCDQYGQCPCNDNVEGQRCDRCKENKHDRHQGCIDCPPCYNLVQDAANSHRAKLADLSRILKEIASKPTVIDDGEFEFKLKSVQELIQILTEEAQIGVGGKHQTPKERLEDFEKRLNKIQELLGETAESRAITESEVENGDYNITAAKNIIQEATNELARAADLLKNDGNSALKEATEKSNQLGQQSGEIGKISHAARLKADEITEETQKTKEKAEAAVQTAMEAFATVKNATVVIDEIDNEIGTTIARDLEEQTEILKSTIKAVQESLVDAEKAYDETLTTFAKVNGLNPPEINIEAIRKDVQTAQQQGDEVETKLNKMLNLSEENKEALKQQIELAELLIRRASENKVDAIELLSSTKAIYDAAKEAVDNGNNILKNATETYNTLSGFQNQVEDSKATASKALESVPKIEEDILNANELNSKAERALVGAQANANSAKKKAEDAQKTYAEQASKEAGDIQKKANDTKSEAKKLRNEADQLTGRVSTTAQRLDELEHKSMEDENLAKEAKEKVGKAQTEVDKAKQHVDKAMNEIKNIIQEIESLEVIKDDDLNDLDNRLAEAEAELNKSDLQFKLEVLKEQKTYQNKAIAEHTAAVEYLENEVDNIRKIAESLPNGCFKTQRLEV